MKNSILSISCLLLLSGCHQINIGRVDDSSQHTPSTELVISAAASLREVMQEIKLLYQQKYPHTKIVYNFAGSGTLQYQIQQGAPVDLFISAASSKIDILQQKNLIVNSTRQDLLTNQMVLIVAKDNPYQITNFNDLVTNKKLRIAIGEPKSVPAGFYAQEILNSLKIADKIKSKLIYAKDVRQVLNYVATGNIDAGIVYRSDAQNSDRVKIVANAPSNTHSPVVYPVAIIKDSSKPDAAIKLIEFLNTSQAQNIFNKYGFKVIK